MGKHLNASAGRARPLRRLLLPALLLGCCAARAAAAEQVYLGEASDERGVLVYTEKHRVTYLEGKAALSLTEYNAPDGTPIAAMRSDYSRSVAMPTYVFEDLRRDYREGLRLQDGAYYIFSQEAGQPEKKARLDDETGVFSCQGWHYYLVNNLDLLEQDNIVLNLVLPSELRPFPFVVKALAADENRVSAELRLKHWLFRYFAPKLRLVYDRHNRRLLEYHGISNILNKNGKRQDVNILYRYNEDSPVVRAGQEPEKNAR